MTAQRIRDLFYRHRPDLLGRAGPVTGADFSDFEIPMLVSCTRCDRTLTALDPAAYVLDDGRYFCGACLPEETRHAAELAERDVLLRAALDELELHGRREQAETSPCRATAARIRDLLGPELDPEAPPAPASDALTFERARDAYRFALSIASDLPDGMEQDLREAAAMYRESKDREGFVEDVAETFASWGFTPPC